MRAIGEQLESGGTVTFSCSVDGQDTAGVRLPAAGDGTGRFEGLLASDDGLLLAAAARSEEPLPGQEGENHG